MIKVSWQKHFKNSLEGAEEAFAKASSSVSARNPQEPAFLTYCLQHNLIQSREYLEWAKETHQIPVLMDDFFLTCSVPTELFRAHENVFSWNPACLPVAEWDGVLMVACLEIPEDFPLHQPAAFLLASPALMAQTWELVAQALVMEVHPSLEIKQTSNSMAAPTPVPAPTAVSDPLEDLLAATSLNPKELFDTNGELLLKDEEPAAEGSNPAIEVSEESEGLPEGFFAETVVDATVLTSFGIDNETKTEAIFAPTPEASAIVKGPRSIEPLGTLKSPVAEEPVSVSLEEPALPQVQKPAAPPQSAPPMPTAPVKPTTSHGATAAYLLEKMRKQSPETFEADVHASFKKLKPYFKKAMLLAVGDKDRVIRPLIWDESFQSPENHTEFDLRTPSFFRIVASTQKPYHGFVVANDFNESFFEVWNQGQVPDHITMVPFMDGDMVIGMLLGIGEKSSYNRQVLQFTESVSKDLAASIMKISGANSARAANKPAA